MSIKHLLIEIEKKKRRREGEQHMGQEDGLDRKQREEQPEQKVITDNYGQGRRKEERGLQNVSIHRNYSFSTALAGS